MSALKYWDSVTSTWKVVAAAPAGLPVGGAANQVLSKIDATDYNTQWVTPSAGGGTPGGATTQVQFNDAGAFGGDAGLVWDKTNDILTNAGKYAASEGSLSSPSYAVNSGSGLFGLYGYAAAISAQGGNFMAFIPGAPRTIRMDTDIAFGWSSSTSFAPLDTALSRNAAGVIEINNGTAGQFRDLTLRTLNIGSTTFQISTTGGNLDFLVSGSPVMALFPNYTRIRNDSQFGWSASADVVNVAADTGLARNAAGVVKVTDGSTGTGTIIGNGTVPAGGTTNQILQKTSGTDYALGWVSPTAGGNVSNSGTPANLQYARWVSSTAIAGVAASTVKTDLGLVKADVGLANVTNDIQTKASIVPNLVGNAGQLLVGVDGVAAWTPRTVSGSGATISVNSTGVFAISAIADASISSAATWNTASTERRQWDGSATNLVAATGRTSLGIGDAVVYENASTATQGGAGVFSSDATIAGSVITIPTAGGWLVGGQYKCVFDITKTAAGTAAMVLQVRIGTAGTTSDLSVFSSTMPAGTAAADAGKVSFSLNWRVVGASAVVAVVMDVVHNNTSVGLWNTATLNGVVGTPAISSAFNSTAATKISASINGGASFNGTVQVVQTQYMQ